MVIVWGQRLFAKVDRVPGLFYVSAQFFHIMFVPLFPLGSYIILKDRAVPTQTLSWRSVLLAYVRIVTIPLGLVLGLVLVSNGSTFRASDLLIALPIEAACLASLIGPRFIKPRYERAVELARQVDFSPAEWELLNDVYGRRADGAVVPRA